ncbi:MAG: META domain-containing protein [Steroidobacteraceae bacterium]
MNAQVLAIFVAALLAITACSKSEPPGSATPPVAEPKPPAAAEPSFVNKVWAVAESEQVEVGSLRTFLSDGTLVMASPHATPAFGTWSYDSGRLTITEEGQKYDVDVVALSENEFRIRIHSPGDPVEILFRQAEQAPAVAARAEPESAPATAARTGEPIARHAEPGSLLGTAWRLEDLAGAAAPAQATLEFPSEGRASGNGSCNRFNGVVTVEGNTITFGGVAATRKACDAAVMRQEEAYFAALQDAERFETDGETLSIYAEGRDEPLRFVASETSALPPQQISKAALAAPASAVPALTGIWTVVAHHMPGTSAMSDDEARARYGQTLRLTTSAATSPVGRCGAPSYATSRVQGDAWLASEYKLPAGSVEPLAARGQSRLMRVSCGGTPWAAFGGLLLEIDADRVLAPWDGVFFELERDRDFRAVGQEPGWQLEIHKGTEMRFTYDYGKGAASTPAPAPQVDSSNGTQTYRAVREANELQVVIVPVACTDAMSGRPFKTTVSVTLNGRTFRGCGEELATPYQG